MDAADLKERILEDEKVVEILEELGMHSIKFQQDYISCGMPDGDNKSSTIVYLDNLNVSAYTRSIEDQYGASDIISLVSFIKDFYFLESIKWLCDICGYDYYGEKVESSKLKSLVNELIKKVKSEKGSDEEKVKPISEKILSYYIDAQNDLFADDNISYETQKEFEVGMDVITHRITIPIRDEIGNLVGVKGRRYINDWDEKYLYLEPTSKTKILYGLHKTLPYIKNKKEVIVVESEKAVMQLWDMGYHNAVAIGGHILSQSHVEKLTHLNVDIVIAYDQGVEIINGEIDKSFYRNEFSKFNEGQSLYCIYDKTGEILDNKESPTDDPSKWERLYRDYKLKVR